MSKWYGKIGFIKTEEQEPGIWLPEIIEKEYSGEATRQMSKWSSNSESTNYDLNISNEISIISDPFLEESIQSIRYVEYMGSFWDVVNIEVQYPRLRITLGGVYSGETAGTA